MTFSDLRHTSIYRSARLPVSTKVCLPSRNVFRLIALEGYLVVHGSGGTVTALGHHSVPADVELLAVVRVREGRVWQCPAVGANHLTLGTRESVIQLLCAQHHITLFTDSDSMLANTRVNTCLNKRWSSTQAMLEYHLKFGYSCFLLFPFQIIVTCKVMEAYRGTKT